MPPRALTPKIIERRRARFLEALTDGHPMIHAFRLSGLPKSTMYVERKTNPDFALAVAEALEHGADVWEAEAKRRAVDGVDKPIYQGGKLVGHERQFSDTLLMFLLTGSKPEKYKRRNEISGTNGGPVIVQVVKFADSPPAGERVGA